MGSPQRREVIVKIGVAQLHDPFGTREVAQRVAAQVGQRDVGRELVDDKRFRRAGEHRLAAVGEVAQPRGAVDRRADVVAFVAQMHVAGVHADSQLDRCQRGPLQLQRAGHRVGGAGERDDEAVALALLDGPDTVMGGDDVGQCLIEPLDGCLHGLGLGLPQPRRTLHVGQQQRDRSSRKLAHVRANVWVAPASFAHASQHAVTCSVETSAKSPIVVAWICVYTRPATADLGVLADGPRSPPRCRLPEIPRANTNAPSIMIGERCAVFLQTANGLR